MFPALESFTYVGLDFETFYSREYTIKKLGVEAYVRDPRFQALGVGVKVGRSGRTVWLEDWDFRRWAKRVDWSRVVLCAHQAHFEGLICSHHYDIRPGMWLDTLSLGRALRTVGGNSLADLSEAFEVGEKGDELRNVVGLRREQMTQAQWEKLGVYCCTDVELMDAILWGHLLPGFPFAELWAIDTTVRMFSEPSFRGDVDLLRKISAVERDRKAATLRKIAEWRKKAAPDEVPPNATDADLAELARATLASSDKFAELLQSRGVTPGKKPGAKGMTWAFAKDDPEMQTLLEHPLPEIRELAKARVEVKSTITESRSERVLSSALKGSVPFYLKYCLAAETLVLTDRGWSPIINVRPTDKVWDGVEWVPHGGVIDQGEREVWEAHGIAGTPDHRFLTSSGWTPWGGLLRDQSRSLFRQALSLVRLPSLTGGPIEHPQDGASAGNQWRDAFADGKDSSTDGTYAKAYGLGGVAPNAGASGGNDALSRCPISRSGDVCSPGSAASSIGAAIQAHQPSSTTADVESPSARNGWTTPLPSCGSFKRSRDGSAQSSTSTASTTTEATSRTTSDWSLERRTAGTSDESVTCNAGLTISKRKTRVYDLSFAGPRSRFVVLTDLGPVIAHNCGAHTHRWSGGDGLNPQNFKRVDTKKPDVLNLRDAIMAAEGEELAVADLSQIEARMLAWIAGENALLETFRRNDRQTWDFQARYVQVPDSKPPVYVRRDGAALTADDLTRIALGEGDFYSDVGSGFFGRKITKAKDKAERQISKALVLGLGFQMSWVRCAGELLKGMLGTDPVQFTMADAQRYGVNVQAFEQRPHGVQLCGEIVRGMTSRLEYDALLIHCAVTDHFVRTYRTTYPRVKALWAAMQQVLEAMNTDADGVVATFGCLKIMRHAIVKPNGMVLRYPGLRRGADGSFTYQAGFKRAHLYGGLLTENVVQSLARDVIAEHMLRIRARGYKIGTSTHDEVVSAVKLGFGGKCLGFMIDTMRQPPAWCLDLPLNAEGGVGLRYGDAK